VSLCQTPLAVLHVTVGCVPQMYAVQACNWLPGLQHRTPACTKDLTGTAAAMDTGGGGTWALMVGAWVVACLGRAMQPTRFDSPLASEPLELTDGSAMVALTVCCRPSKLTRITL
jgi:hypothetical protein